MMARLYYGIRKRIRRLIYGQNASLIEARRLLLTEQKLLSAYKVGKWSYGTPKVIRWRSNQILEVGKFCSFAEDTVIMLGGEHHSEFVSTFPFGRFFDEKFSDNHEWTRGNVRIGNDVWIGRGALILSGVAIGDGAIVGAESVVAKDIPPYAVVVGNPARVIRKRFDDEIIEALLRIRWWDWSDEKVRIGVPELMSSNINAFVRQHDRTTKIK